MTRLLIRNSSLLLLLVTLSQPFQAAAQAYLPIHGWPVAVNDRLSDFFQRSRQLRQRKIAVFDADGTLLGQVPYYLADEAIYSYAAEHYSRRHDARSMAKMALIQTMKHLPNTSLPYLKGRIDFLSGMRPAEAGAWGKAVFMRKYSRQIYPQMKALVGNLKRFGFEVWIISASPEVLYQQFLHEQLGIPLERILGVRSVISRNRITGRLVLPLPQGYGKAELIQTAIKARSLLVAGNSEGDVAMLAESVGLKLLVNPDDSKVICEAPGNPARGMTLKNYGLKHQALLVKCLDTLRSSSAFTCVKIGIAVNPATY